MDVFAYCSSIAGLYVSRIEFGGCHHQQECRRSIFAIQVEWNNFAILKQHSTVVAKQDFKVAINSSLPFLVAIVMHSKEPE